MFFKHVRVCCYSGVSAPPIRLKGIKSLSGYKQEVTDYLRLSKLKVVLPNGRARAPNPAPQRQSGVANEPLSKLCSPSLFHPTTDMYTNTVTVTIS